MSDNAMKIRFKVYSDELALITVETVHPGFTLNVKSPEDGWSVQQLGFADSPLFEFVCHPSPDIPWKLRPLEGGRVMSRGGDSAEREAIEWGSAETGLIEWSPAQFADDLLILTRHLPDGTYYLVHHIVRSPQLPPHLLDRVLLGNDWVESPGDHLQVLYEADRNYAGLVGSVTGCSPDLSQPLLGISVLNFTGNPRPTAALFFSCLEPASPSEAPTEGDTVLLVIPRTGPLVFDNMAAFSAEQSARDKRRWADTLAKRYALQLTRAPWHQ